ncbi:uncharacterized protein L3040_002427 [Drepanopeziza brunnea f. sp. 'multigermtubi']|uniref:uncharacterized protein n=1 Tax=Drepanopeziza brunnea f. sp. 'multigermtubi' TaxID=698441 RepID=UPI002390C06F|nr:hypothetical protein L3040_002427 [Drepanopeziza brunnea f. sp. 'multigermtubi']
MSFDTITPSEKLEWHSCFSHVFCARLTVPMDYNRPLNTSSANPKVHIALLLIPGKRKGSSRSSTSPLLLNPGGPGGSGVQFALLAGSQLQTVVGEEQDVIGFDPRGVGATTPRADCFAYPSEAANRDASLVVRDEDYIRGNFHRATWVTAGTAIGTVNSSADSLLRLDVRARTMARLCGEKDALYGNGSILRYAHTPSVARDMLSIVDAWDEWRGRTGDADPDEKTVMTPDSDGEASADTKGKLVYWGFSYGTLLGATFAAMFPDRVGRVILDGVVDADHYVSPVWQGTIQDADKVSTSFSYYCHKARVNCALYRPSDTISSIEDRFQSILSRIHERPITSIHPFSRQPVVTTISQVRMMLFSILYSPNRGFPAVAWIFDQLLRGNEDVLAQVFPLPEPELLCAPQTPAEVLPNEAQIAIMCSDKRYPFNASLPEIQHTFEEMAQESSWADVWMTVMIACDAYPVQATDPPMRWDDHPPHRADPVPTAFPLLFLSNTADPVTPLAAGVKMARRFVAAGLVEQRSMGHCSIAAVSGCTIRKIRAYLREGVVPPHPVRGRRGRELVDGKWDRCSADEYPWKPFAGGITVAEPGTEPGTGEGEVEAEVSSMRAMKEVQEVFGKMRSWGQPGLPLDFDAVMPMPKRSE